MPVDLTPFLINDVNNYTGPIAVNTAFHVVLHLQVNTGTTFDVNPTNVIQNPEDYGESVVAAPALILVILVAGTLVLWILQCVYCDVPCQVDCRRNCQACCNCPQECCDPVTRDRAQSLGGLDPPTIAVWVLGMIGVVTLLASLVLWYVTSFEVHDVLTDLDQLDDYRTDIREQTEAISLLAQTANATLTTVILPLAVHATSPPLNASVLLALNTTAVDASASAVVELNAVASQANINLDLRSAIDDIRSNTGLVVWGSLAVVAVMIILFVAGTLAAYTPDEPLRGCVDASQALMGCWSLLLAFLIFVLFSLAIAGGDVCQQPTAYLNAWNDHTDGNDVIAYYLNCAPGVDSPFEHGLTSAYNSTTTVISVLQQLVVAATATNHTSVVPPTLLLIEFDEQLLDEIQFTRALTRCNYPHNQLTVIEENSCWRVYPYGVASMFCTWFGYLLLLAAAWAWAKQARPSRDYQSVSRDPPAAAADAAAKTPPPTAPIELRTPKQPTRQ